MKTFSSGLSITFVKSKRKQKEKRKKKNLIVTTKLIMNIWEDQQELLQTCFPNAKCKNATTIVIAIPKEQLNVMWITKISSVRTKKVNRQTLKH